MATRKSVSKELTYYATGRRKASVARVYLTKGTGTITVNSKDIKEFFPHETQGLDINQPFKVTQTEGQYNVKAFTNGGGFTGQSGALRLGIARCLAQISDDYRAVLRINKLLTVDSRQVERKKYGLKKARKDSQFSKR